MCKCPAGQAKRLYIVSESADEAMISFRGIYSHAEMQVDSITETTVEHFQEKQKTVLPFIQKRV
jgi:hypothetical protein